MSRDLNEYRDLCHVNSVNSGWWDDVCQGKRRLAEVTPTKLCLIHSEVSEAMEGFRKDLMDDHLPHRKMAEVELADALIRIFDLAGAHGFDLTGAVEEKLEYNKKRSDHKRAARAQEGGKKF